MKMLDTHGDKVVVVDGQQGNELGVVTVSKELQNAKSARNSIRKPLGEQLPERGRSHREIIL